LPQHAESRPAASEIRSFCTVRQEGGVQETHTTFSTGQQVIVRDEPWSILSREAFGSTLLYRLRGIGDSNRDELQSVLAPFDAVAPSPSTTRLRPASPPRVLRLAAHTIADSPAWPEPWTVVRARIDLHAWQLQPALAATQGATRILLADGVGLGKTIEAGLIIAELCARGLAERVLVLTPAAIRAQWAGELRSKFGHTAAVFDQAALAELATSLPPDVNPWKTAPLIVSSIDLVKRPEVRAALDGVPLDVLVVDEAHHLTPGSDRGAVVADLAARTPWVVLVTATPHSGNDQAYRFLINLGHVGSEPVQVFRRSGGGDRARRRSRILLVTPTLEERALLDATWEYARALSTSGSPGARLVASVIARRAASSAVALARTVMRRATLLSGQPSPAPQPTLPWDEFDDVDDDVSDSLLSAHGLGDREREQSHLNRLLHLAAASSVVSSKIAVIRRLLRRTHDQLLVFSEYRDVAVHVADAIRGDTTVAALHGGLSLRQRQHAVEQFNAGLVRTLVATDAAGEGLNLHRYCRLVLNVELPWTPQRLEQRIGRVDRMGQTRRVHALHLAHRGSFEGTVIARLERRRSRAMAQTTALEKMPSDSAPSIRRGFFHIAPEDLDRRPRAAYGVRLHKPGGPAARAPRQADTVIMLFATPVHTASGLVVQQHLTPLRIGIAPVRRLRRRMVRSLVMSAAVNDAVRADVRRHVCAVSDQMGTVSKQLSNRVAALVREVERRARSRAWQGSLFDRREEQAAGRHASELAILSEHLLRRRDSFMKLAQLRAGDSRLVTAWLGAS
jgi:ERCC4-related helicase